MYQKKAEETSYDKFQRSKEEGMAIMAANRDATMIVCELIGAGRYNGASESTLKEEIKKWRKFFYVEIYNTAPDEQLKQEAKEALNSVPFFLNYAKKNLRSRRAM